ncbi:hypothetical protein APA_3517 [Pseudanabaena sp. lw0831]|nr:hypothetical protein APA_3517 [Pseudanabaena sp. lw0831]
MPDAPETPNTIAFLFCIQYLNSAFNSAQYSCNTNQSPKDERRRDAPPLIFWF